eukprot:2178-Heterococcus_DN1.PRE.1
MKYRYELAKWTAMTVQAEIFCGLGKIAASEASQNCVSKYCTKCQLHMRSCCGKYLLQAEPPVLPGPVLDWRTLSLCVRWAIMRPHTHRVSSRGGLAEPLSLSYHHFTLHYCCCAFTCVKFSLAPAAMTGSSDTPPVLQYMRRQLHAAICAAVTAAAAAAATAIICCVCSTVVCVCVTSSQQLAELVQLADGAVVPSPAVAAAAHLTAACPYAQAPT